MADSPKTLRHVLLAEVHRLTVTGADVDGENCLRLDRTVAQAAGFSQFEKIEIANATNGARFAAALTFADANSGTLAIDGAGAHLARVGDVVSVSAFGWLKEKQLLKHEPLRITVNAQNTVVSVTHPEKKQKKKA